MEAIKISDSVVRIVTQTPAPEPTAQDYNYDELLEQKARIIKDTNSYLEARQKELDYVNSLIAQADALGVTSKVMPEPLGE